MIKLWTILVGVAIAGAAQAQTTDWKWNAELRTRYTNLMNPAYAKGGDSASFQGRTKLGTTMMKGDNLTGHVTLLNNAMWGDKANNAGLANGTATHSTVTAGNSLLVQEAWGWWKSNEMLSLKFGRAAFEYGDGTIFSVDDWQATPNSWEGVWSQWTFDFADVHFFGTKLWDGDVAVAGNSDPEVVAYGLVLNFKNLPEFMKKGFVHVVQINGDQVTGLAAATGVAGASSINRLHYGLTAMGDVAAFDYRLTADMESGKIKAGTADTTLSAMMLDMEFGWNMPEFMKARVSLMAHMDGGDDSATADKSEHYSALYYDKHKYAGLMDVVGWGNATYYGLGFTLNPAEDLSAGLNYLMFSRSTDKDFAYSDAGTPIAAGDATKKDVGSEIDLWANKTYGENFSIYAFYGIFTPGGYIKGSGSAENFSKLTLQGKLTF